MELLTESKILILLNGIIVVVVVNCWLSQPFDKPNYSMHEKGLNGNCIQEEDLNIILLFCEVLLSTIDCYLCI